MVMTFSDFQTIDSANIDVVTFYPYNRVGIRLKSGQFIEIKKATEQDISSLKASHVRTSQSVPLQQPAACSVGPKVINLEMNTRPFHSRVAF
jgi:hypothetical protein